MGKQVLVGVVGVLVLLLLVLFGILQGRGGSGEVLLGAALPLTGPGAQYGLLPQQAVDLAIEQRSRAGFPYEVRVIYEDTQLKPNLGLTAIRKLIDVHRVPVVFGAAGSNVTEVIGPVAQESGVVLISPSSTAASLSNIGDYFFRTIPTDAYEGTFMGRFVYEQGVRKVGLFAVNDTGTKSLVDNFRGEFEKLGGKTVQYVLAPKDATDLRTQITSLRAASPEAVFLVGYANETGVFLKQAGDLQLEVPLYSAHPAEAPEVRTIAGAAADGIIFSTPAQAGQSLAARAFAQAFRERYGDEPGEFAPEAFDAAMLVLDAIEEMGPEAAKIREHLQGVRDYQGASGTITFSPTGDVEKPIQIMMIRDGELVPFEG